MLRNYKNVKLTAGMVLAGLASTASVSATHSAVAHASTVVASDQSKTNNTQAGEQKDSQKTLTFTTANAENNSKSKNGGGTEGSLTHTASDNTVPLSNKDVENQNANLNKSNEKRNFDQAVSDAKNTDGVQVIKDADVWHTPSSHSEEDAKKDYQAQSENLKKQIDAQKQKLNEYNKQKQEYDKKRQAFIDQLKQEGLWQDGATDPSKLAQNLVISREPQAKTNITVLNPSAGKLNTAQDQIVDGEGWTNTWRDKTGTVQGQDFEFSTLEAIPGDFLRVDYTNLKNSSYAGKSISKISVTFSDKPKGLPFNSSSFNMQNHNNLQFWNDPTLGWVYTGFNGVTADIKLYDENGKQILFDSKHPAYLTAGSLNFGEGVRLLSDGSAIKIPESSVNVHDNNVLYADKDNGDMSQWSKDIQNKYTGWDNADNPNRIFGSGLYKVTGDHIKLRSFGVSLGENGVGNGGPWFTWSTTVPQTSFDAEGPQKPELTIHYHDNKVKSLNTITVKYIDQDTNKEIPNTEFTQTGVEGDAIKYSTADTIKKLQDQGYTLVNDDFTNKAGDKLTAQNNDKTYVVTLKKIKPQVKQGTQTFNFVDKKTGKIITTSKVGGDVGKDIPISLKVPDGYKLVEGQKVPTSANIKEEDKPINILVEKINTAKSSIDSLTVKYIDADTGKEIPNTEFNQKGNEGDAITYSTAKTIKDLQSKGYTLVSDGFTNKAGSKLSSENNGKTYVVTLKKVKTTPKVQNGTQTYHFVDKNTGKVLTTNQVKGEVGKNVPISLKVPDGYKLVEGQKVPTSASIKGKDNPINILVEKISKPEVKTVTQPTVAKTLPQKQTAKLDKPVAKASKASNSNVAPITKQVVKSATLPQTGNSKSTAGVLAGTALVATMASLGIAYSKKKSK